MRHLKSFNESEDYHYINGTTSFNKNGTTSFNKNGTTSFKKFGTKL
jgi:hypothetical protein